MSDSVMLNKFIYILYLFKDSKINVFTITLLNIKSSRFMRKTIMWKNVQEVDWLMRFTWNKYLCSKLIRMLEFVCTHAKHTKF